MEITKKKKNLCTEQHAFASGKRKIYCFSRLLNCNVVLGKVVNAGMNKWQMEKLRTKQKDTSWNFYHKEEQWN